MSGPIAVVICHGGYDQKKILHLGYGIEEEGLPFVIEKGQDTTPESLAMEASFLSGLDVGIGVDRWGRIALHQVKLPEGQVLFLDQIEDIDARSYGQNAARLIKQIPLKKYTDEGGDL